jgi:hypothetical protein
VAAFCALRPIWDIDEWWQIVVGRWILDHRALPTVDVWSSVTPQPGWRSCQWLWQAGAAFVDRRFGLETLRRLNAGWIAASFALFYWWARRSGEKLAHALLLAAALLCAFHDRIRVRPTVVSMTFWIALAFLVPLLRRSNWRAPAIFGGLFLGWAAIHSAEAWLGAGCLVAAAIVLILRRRKGALAIDRTSLACVLAALLGWVIVPGSVDGLFSLAAQNHEVTTANGEWIGWLGVVRAILAGEGSLNAIVAVLIPPIALATFGLALRRWWRLSTENVRNEATDRPFELAVAGAFLALAFFWYRYDYLALLSIVLCRSWTRSVAASSEMMPRSQIISLALAIFALAVSLHFTTLGQFPSLRAAIAARGRTVDESRFPVAMARKLCDSGIEARVATPGGWGGYLLYCGWPRLTVTIDGRLNAPGEIRNANEVLAKILTTGRGAELLPKIYSSLPADILLMPHPSFLGRSDTGEWILVASDETADIWARKSSRAEAEWMPKLRDRLQ